MIYVVRGRNKRRKIGFTKTEISRRLAAFDNGLIVSTFVEGSLRQEKLIHALLQNELRNEAKPCGGEWYTGLKLIGQIEKRLNLDVASTITWLQKKALQTIHEKEQKLAKEKLSIDRAIRMLLQIGFTKIQIRQLFVGGYSAIEHKPRRKDACE